MIGQAHVAALIGVSLKTINDWQAEGFPVAVRGGSNRPSEYDSAECLRWVVARAVAKASLPESPRDRLFRIQGEALELQLTEQRARLVPVAAITPLWTSAVEAARVMLAESRAVTVARLEAAIDRAACERVIAEESEAMLRRIAAWRPSPAPAADDRGAS